MPTVTMAQIDYQCDTCKALVRADTDQTDIDGRLRWYLSYRCSNCGTNVESDDTGIVVFQLKWHKVEGR